MIPVSKPIPILLKTPMTGTSLTPVFIGHSLPGWDTLGFLG
jgi:hypothetical protein